jgi:hypothetical protein
VDERIGGNVEDVTGNDERRIMLFYGVWTLWSWIWNIYLHLYVSMSFTIRHVIAL